MKAFFDYFFVNSKNSVVPWICETNLMQIANFNLKFSFNLIELNFGIDLRDANLIV